MLLFKTQNELIFYLQSVVNDTSTIGFVPTMGVLHDGHLSLLKESLKCNNITVISIFVNPTQFDNAIDLKDYPKTLEKDILKLKTISDNIIVFAPTADDIYGGKIISHHFDFDGLENQLEGKFRPGHFDGVGTIVKRLFEIVKPNNAYFGEKDFQQMLIIKKMIQKNKIPVKVIGCSIYREENGLAMSSRNERLTVEDRKNASIIYKTILESKELFTHNSATKVTDFVINIFKKYPDFKLEYFQIADEATLEPCLRKNKNKKYRAFIAVFINKIRLIDTISLN